jgi:6-phosphogluconolactonase
MSPGGEPTVADEPAGPDEPVVIVAVDPETLARTAAGLIVDRLAASVARRGRADIALTGGSTPRSIYRRLVEPGLVDRVPWPRIHLWWGDDRFVRRTDPLSNVLAADEILLAPGGIPIPATNVHPFPNDQAVAGGHGPGWCADRYAAEVAAALPSLGRWPAFDLVLVGIGEDGHLLSVFPGSVALTSDRLGLGIPAPTHIEPHVERVTLNPAILAAAGHVLAIVAGASKAAVVARILEGPRDPASRPGVLARRANATWLLDAAAARSLEGHPRPVDERSA